jgi:hypothetical protein
MRCALASRIMPRTTLDLDASIVQELRARGKREGKSMGALASELLAPALARHDPAARPPALSWTSADLGAPLVDLEDRDALHAALERRA